MPPKKTKEADSSQSPDSFSPLDIQTRDIRTAVLMLESPEEMLVAKSCEALYKYSILSDCNRIEMVKLDLLPKLISKLTHSEKSIRAHAVMCLGSLVSVPDIRRDRRIIECVQQITNLLMEDEEAITKEHATLTLSHLAQNFSSKLKLHEAGAIEKLVKLLATSIDPETLRNAIKTICLLSEYHLARFTIQECGGLQYIIELLNSEYASIQELALITMGHCTRDDKVRLGFRESDGLKQLISFLGNDECSDLHVHALRVLSHCLEDYESLELIQSSGLLETLLAHISNATLPEVKQFASEAIGRASKSPQARKLFYDQGAVGILVTLLSDDNDRVCIASAYAISNLTKYSLAKEQLAQEDINGLQGLLNQLAREGELEADLKEAGLCALCEASSDSPQNKNKLGGDLRALDVIVPLLNHLRCHVQVRSAQVLENFCLNEVYRGDIVQLSGIEMLTDGLSSTDAKVRISFCKLLTYLSLDTATHAYLATYDTYTKLIALLIDSTNSEVRKAAAETVSILAGKPLAARELCIRGCLQQLQLVSNSMTLNNSFATHALDMLISTNIVVKFWTTGKLTQWDHIENGFYDVGPSALSMEFRSLQDLSKEPVSDKLVLLTINAKQEDTNITPVPNEELIKDTKKDDTPGGTKERSKSRKSGVDSKSSQRKSKTEKESKEEDTLEGVVESHEPQLTVPCDPVLVELVQRAKALIKSVNDQTELVHEVASIVAIHMGGSIEKTSLNSFDYKLHISQLKHDRQSNLLPLATINRGVYHHRALLFKYLCDQLSILCTLTRSQYGRSWNEVMLSDTPPESDKILPSKAYVVDLLYNPGQLMRAGSPEAIVYQQI